MLNIEKYKKEIIAFAKGKYSNLTLLQLFMADKTGRNYKEILNTQVLDWLTEEYKEPILDKAEKEYLSAIIEPFIDMVEYIYKGIRHKNDYVIRIDLKSDKSEIYTRSISFPLLEGELMFKGMELNKYYTLEELGL